MSLLSEKQFKICIIQPGGYLVDTFCDMINGL